MVTLEENEMRFDAETRPHGHFKCTCCGNIYDFFCDAIQADPQQNLPEGFSVEETQLYVLGRCKDCNEAQKKEAV